MSRRKSVSVDESGTKEAWKTKLHRVDFSPKDEVEVQEWVTANKPDWSACLSELLDDGWSIKITPPSSRDDWWVTGTYKLDGEDFTAHSFSVVYPDMEACMILLYWALTVALEEGRLDTLFSKRGTKWLQT